MALTRSDENRHDFAFIAGAIIGAIAGALVTLALTPMSGADTREKIKSRAGELGPIKERALEAAAPVKEKAGTLATTATEKGKTLAATGKERAAGLAAKSPIGRGQGDDASGVSPDEAGAMIFGNEPGAQPGGIVTPGALADAASEVNVTGTTERPPQINAQDVADAARDAASDSGNGRVSEKPAS